MNEEEKFLYWVDLNHPHFMISGAQLRYVKAYFDGDTRAKFAWTSVNSKEAIQELLYEYKNNS